jgi:hypothetical protein
MHLHSWSSAGRRDNYGIMEEVPRIFVRRLSPQVQLSTSTRHSILKKDIHL